MTGVEKAHKQAEAEGARSYSEGVAKGFELALRLTLGEPYGQATPNPGADELEGTVTEQWARDAIARLTEATS